MNFGVNIIAWYDLNKRDLPWRKTKDPYKIWLSEVLLQQTRVDQGMGYYLRFIKSYPTVQDLANAAEEDILNLWQGLGYYSRARNLHFASKQIVNDFDGVFPVTYKDILTLKGVGDYTASAIASICFGEQVAVVDGNVYRVLSRYLMIDTPIDTSKGVKQFKSVAVELIEGSDPNRFNQGVMELGATICTPKKPNCIECPINESCMSYAAQEMLAFPVKSKKLKQKVKYFNYLVIEDGESTFLEQRVGKGIWENMYQFPLIETSKELLILDAEAKGLILKKVSLPVKHILSHQIIYVKFWECEVNHDFFVPDECWQRITFDKIETKPVPKVIENYIRKLEK
jgi:A/G-specific adenine glycosylase